MADLSASASLVCAFLAAALSSFDIFPWTRWPMPPRPFYYAALPGMLLWFCSLRWIPGIRRHWPLFLLVFLLLVLGGTSTWVGAAHHNSERLFTFFTHMYLRERVVPFLVLCWAADLFSSLPKGRAKRVFSLALIVLFIPNAVHMALEIAANIGACSVKDFLIAINPYFRLEATAHGWWPPPYFTGRVRGLFAEPGYMALGLFPLFGLFCYGAMRNKRCLLPLFFLLVALCAAKAYSGLIATAVFFGLLGLWALSRMPVRRRAACLAMALAVLAALAATARHSPRIADVSRLVQSRLQTNEAIAAYVRDVHDGKNPNLPVLDYTRRIPIAVFNRLLSMRLDLDMGRRFPLLGTGFLQRGFYWQPLERLKGHDQEWQLWVKYAADDPFKLIPHLSEYTSVLAENGLPGLCVELLLFAFIAFRALRRFCITRDAYIGCMLCAYLAMLVALGCTPVVSTSLFPLFAGFLYGVSTRSGTGAALRT